MSKPQKIVGISDKEFIYYITRAKNPESAPILLCFHGWNGANGAQTRGEKDYGDTNWNTVFFLDYWGFNRMGCWFLGEGANYFFLSLIDLMIEELRTKHNLKGEIYTYGSSMGGYGAAFHGIRLKVPSIVLDIPQTCLLGNTYGRYHSGKLQDVFSNDIVEYVNSLAGVDDCESTYIHKSFFDISTLLESAVDEYKPMIFIKQSRFDCSDGGNGNTYIADQTQRFVNTLIRRASPFQLVVENRNAHITTWWLDDAVRLIGNGICTVQGEGDIKL